MRCSKAGRTRGQHKANYRQEEDDTVHEAHESINISVHKSIEILIWAHKSAYVVMYMFVNQTGLYTVGVPTQR